MDSLTQFVLGAAVSTACLGKTLGPRKAALIGGALGTLPDLDVFIPFADPVDSFVYHRGWTHSVFVHALATPLIGEGLIRLFRSLRDHRWMTWLAVFLCLSTHALIDAMTVYGTRLFWPVHPDPVGVGSIFIIDPVYTLPLLGVVVWALCRRHWTPRLRTGVAIALVFSTGYMGLSAVIQRYVEWQANEVFRSEGVPADRIYAIASPFNILVWKVIGLSETSYANFYFSLLDGQGSPEIYEHPRHPELVACLKETAAFRKLEWFSRGFWRADLEGSKIVLSDLRMGLTPGYVFRFAIAETAGKDVTPLPPERAPALVQVEPGDWAWLAARLQGEPSIRKAEAKIAGRTQTAGLNACKSPASG